MNKLIEKLLANDADGAVLLAYGPYGFFAKFAILSRKDGFVAVPEIHKGTIKNLENAGFEKIS